MNNRKILVTSDDGIDGAGLKSLVEKLSAVGGVDVYVLAPDSNRSAVSSLLTMTEPMKFVRRRDKGERWFSCSGSPVDCVIAALCSTLFGESVKFDAVFSGINKGANLGTDIVYSGTCAAARQSVLYDIPGIAVSVESYDGTWKFDDVADFCAKNLDRLISLCRSGSSEKSSCDLFVSVNASSSDNHKDAVFTSLSARDYCDRISILNDPNENADVFYGFFRGGQIKSNVRDRRSPLDFDVSFGGGISVTRVFAEPTAFDDSGSIF
ncbi:MAG: 5'/3'-nucleotidase SurE [Treponema sp.]|nr:5'/3'-nucleotidase SurE [Treponema sp.]